jgi:heme a synthase
MPYSRFAAFSWFYLAYLLAVIVYGAWVRISGSGDGCGNHWPLCNGDVLPTAPATRTIIEFTHRLTSGACGLFSLVQVFWAWRAMPVALRPALWTLFFVLTEGFIGAVLVKQALVAQDTSAARAIVIALHLTNTLLLTACATSVARAASPSTPRALAAQRPLLRLAMLAIVVTCMTGAITALGDTLFPKAPALDGGLLAQVRGDLSAGHHFLVRLRIVHPFVAVFTAFFVAFATTRFRKSLRSHMLFSHALIGVQLVLGVLNILLGAPGWMQLLHLLASQLIWVVLCLLWLETRVSRPVRPASSLQTHPAPAAG